MIGQRIAMERVISYIDGFNLYFGLKSAKLERYLWLDLNKLSLNLLKKFQQLVQVKYFTSRITGPTDKQKCQSTYIEALEGLSNLEIYYGKYQLNPQICRNCDYKSMVLSEKMTDVNIAVQILIDAYQNNYDTALLISADSDLIGPITAVRKLFPKKRIVIAFPPDRFSRELANNASGYFVIGHKKFAQSQLPNDYQQKFFNFQELLEFAFIFQCEGVTAGSVQEILGCSSKTAKDLQTEVARLEPWQVIARSPEKTEEFVKFIAEAFYKSY